MNSLLLLKTTLQWYSGLQLLPSYIYDPWCRVLKMIGAIPPASLIVILVVPGQNDSIDQVRQVA